MAMPNGSNGSESMECPEFFLPLFSAFSGTRSRLAALPEAAFTLPEAASAPPASSRVVVTEYVEPPEPTDVVQAPEEEEEGDNVIDLTEYESRDFGCVRDRWF
ncbi:uncharacterized protein LOC127750330 [Frankliniella occidentalis]|uniref:Uncharacterized protein LOC127750330 n=1 Tax=Frankliniella occidentalis TaxID=133901 RepID=A0A9C6XQS5_FRAOC|nr:uncharacterized protein LOC127750330 [Frankliniella occidentalis]